MSALHKGIIVAVVHLAIVCSLGGKLLYDRATRPRVWVRTMSYDPDLPIRGRYASMRLQVEAPLSSRGVQGDARYPWGVSKQGRLTVENGKLAVVPYDDLSVRYTFPQPA